MLLQVVLGISSEVITLRPSSDCLDTLDGRIYTVLPLLFRRRTYRRVSDGWILDGEERISKLI